MTTLNSEPYNKFINKKAHISTEAMAVNNKSELLDGRDYNVNGSSDYINSWSSRKHDVESFFETTKRSLEIFNKE